MAHFAKVKDGIVEQVIVVNNEVILDEDGIEQESIGQEFCSNLFGGDWVQTSFNKNFRFNYAGIGFTYDPIDDAFIPPMLTCGHEEVTLNSTKNWECSNVEHIVIS